MSTVLFVFFVLRILCLFTYFLSEEHSGIFKVFEVSVVFLNHGKRIYNNPNHMDTRIFLKEKKQRLNRHLSHFTCLLYSFHCRGIAKVGEPNNISPLTSSIVYMDPAIHTTLRRRQRRLVRENPGVLAALVKGANLAISECQHQFRNRRWNCSTKNFLRGKNLFGKIVDRGMNNFLNFFLFIFWKS